MDIVEAKGRKSLRPWPYCEVVGNKKMKHT